MSNIPDEYAMEAGTSGLLETCNESRMLIETVGTLVEDNNTEGEKYFVVTTDGEQQNLIQIAEPEEKFDGDNLTEQNQPWAVICRICANTSDHLIPIFKGEGLEHGFNNKIQRYLPIQVSEEDSLPLHLCYHCAATLLAWHELADGCLEAEQRLLQMQNDYQQKNQSKILGETLNRETATLTTEEICASIENPLSEEELVVKGEFNEEPTANDTERYTNYIHSARPSSFTEFRGAYQALLQTYRRQVKPLYQLASKSDQWLDVDSSDNRTGHSSRVDTNDKAQLPEKQLISTDVLRRNVIDIFNDESSSPVVVNDSVITTAFSQPIIIENDGSIVEVSPALPTDSEEKSSQVEKAGVELPSVSSNTSYDCKLCSKKFRLQDSFRAHMNMHTDAKRYTCHICGKQFGQTGSLYYHLKHVHGGVKQHSCDLCGRSFAMKAAMEDHRRIHTGERPYCCASCGKTFKTKASLYIHSKTHTDELPHKCSYCPKAFRWRQQMLGHLTIHTGQKNHICEICGKRFGVKNDLTRHKRIHSEEKPFMCQQCGLSFGQKRYLKNHERTRHK